MTAIIIQILEIVIIPILGALASLLIAYINKKQQEVDVNIKDTKQEKYLKILQSAIEDAVRATNQTFVEKIKEKGGPLSEEEQREAFLMTFSAVTAALSDEAVECLETALGDLQVFITQKIESQVNLEKKNNGQA